MKKLKHFIAVAALTGALTFSAKAFTIDPSLTFLGAVDFNNGPNSPDANLAALATFLGTSVSGFNLVLNVESSPGINGPISDTAGDFLVVHYGVGPGGTGSGGSLEFFQVNAGFTSDTLPQLGNVGGADPFGHGGISSIREFAPRVPDSGTTAMLLGGALTGLGVVRRYLKR